MSIAAFAPDTLIPLDYARRGWKVLPLHTSTGDGCSCGRSPCDKTGKHPRTPHGVADASADPGVIRGWAQTWPEANVGIAAGAESSLVVLDIDPRHGGDGSLRELEATYGPLPETVEAVTGGGGRHLYFQHPGGHVPSPIGIRPGIDVRADGTFVVAPPSLHHSGERYEWEVEHHPDDREVAPPPQWLSEIIRNRPAQSTVLPSRIPKGERNATLTSLAGSMRRRGMGQAAIEAALRAENAERCDPPLPDTEVAGIATSVTRYSPERAATSLPTIGSSVGGQVRVLSEANGADLARAAGTEKTLPSLPFLGQQGYFIVNWSHLVAGYPRCGKTELLVRLAREWIGQGRRVLYLSEEPRSLWGARLSRLPGDWSGLTVVFALGADPRDLVARMRTGPEEIVIVDTLRNLLQLRDETDNSEAARVLMPWIVQARESGKTLIVLHHQRKGGGEHGEGIAGGHAFLGTCDIAIEIAYDKAPNRRVVRAHARVIAPGELVYEMDEAGEMRALGDPQDVALAEVRERVVGVLSDQWQKTSDVQDSLEEPRPSPEQVRKALQAAARDGKIERDPDISVGDVRGKTVRWRLAAAQTLVPTTAVVVGSEVPELSPEPVALRPVPLGDDEDDPMLRAARDVLGLTVVETSTETGVLAEAAA